MESVFEKKETVMKVPATELRFTQRRCSFYFRCMHRRLSSECRHCPTRSVQDTAEEIVNGMDPSNKDWAMLDVVKQDGVLRFIDNRRLFAFQEAQRQLREKGQERTVWVRVRTYSWHPQFNRFLKHMAYWDEPGGGEDIEVKWWQRQHKRHRHR